MSKLSFPAPPAWTVVPGDGPVIGVALHDGHHVRPEILSHMVISEDDRLREEDPLTGDWVGVGATQVVVHRSRFELDLNRPRERAIYRTPEEAWGLVVWKEIPPRALLEQSLAAYDQFYREMFELLCDIESRHGYFVVYDLHSYNYRRYGRNAPPEPAIENPEIDVDATPVDKERWGALLDRFLSDLRGYEFQGRRLDVRTNIKFPGSHFAQWVCRNFPETGLALSVEVRKFFMDEWDGTPFRETVDEVGELLRATVPGVLSELSRAKA